MIRLWHPMRDPHHCSFRMLALLSCAEDHQIQIPKLSFLDLFLLFPQYLRDVKVASEAVERKRMLRLPAKKDSFVHIPDIRLVYRDLQQYQKIALNRLVGKGIVSYEHYTSQIAKLNLDALPDDLGSHIKRQTEIDNELLTFIVKDIGGLPIDGPNSLLRQTKLELGGRLR